MPVPLLAAIGMGVSAGGSAAGGMAANAATKEGAQAQLAIDRLNRQFQGEMFEEQLGQQQPYLDLGTQAAPMLGSLISGQGYTTTREETVPGEMVDYGQHPGSGILGGAMRSRGMVQGPDTTRTVTGQHAAVDPTQLHAYKFQDENMQQMMGEKFGTPSLGVMGSLRNRLGVQERESTKNRLYDLMKIGMGSSETAGRSGSVTANALSNAMMQSAGIRGNLQSQLYNQQQSMANQAVQGVGAIPAYMAYQNYAGGGVGGYR